MSAYAQARALRDLHTAWSDALNDTIEALLAYSESAAGLDRLATRLYPIAAYHDDQIRHAAQAVKNTEAHGCAWCATELTRKRLGRPPRYCSTACRSAAYRARRLPPCLYCSVPHADGPCAIPEPW